MTDTSQVILSVQVAEYPHYARTATDKFMEEVKPRLRDAPVICWTQTCSAFAIPSSEFTWEKLNRCSHAFGKYDPEAMLETVGKVVNENGIHTFEFVLFTYSIVGDYNWESFRDKLRTSTFYTHIGQVTLCFPTINPEYTPDKFVRAFHGLPVKVHFEDLFLDIPKEIRVPSLTSKPLFDYHSFLNEFGQYIYLNPTTKAERAVLLQTLKDVEKRYFFDINQGQRSCLRPFGDRSSSESVVRGYIETQRWAKLRKFHDETLRRQLLIFAQNKFRRLYDLLEKPEISFIDFTCFIPSQLYSYRGREAFSIVNHEEEANMNDDTPDRVPLCIVDQMDPEAPAIHYEVNTTMFYKNYAECEECPLFLLEYFNVTSLNSGITCYRRAGDYKKPEIKEEEATENDEYQRVGIRLYKFQNMDNPDSELQKPRTREDDNVVEIIRAFDDSRWRAERNRGLIAIVFLFALYLTDKVQNNEFIKKCIRHTIIRISLVYKCNLSIFKSEHPHIYMRIYDALIYAVHVSCMEPDPSKNFYSRLRGAGPYFVLLMESIFQQKFPKPINVRCWLALHYMTKIAEDDKKLMEAVAMTKVAGWIHTAKGPLLLTGKESDKCYHELLDGLTSTDVFKLKKLIDDDVNLYTNKFDFCLAEVDIAVTIPSVKYDTPLEEVYYRHVRICESTCRPTINCQETGAPWKECFPKEMRQPHLSFFNLFGKYCNEYRKYPTDADMMAYLAKSFPLETFYQNTEEILRHITEEFKRMNIEMDTFLERFAKSKTLERRTQTEADCKCSAHTPNTVEHSKPAGIYVLVLAFIVSLIALLVGYMCK